MWKWKRRDADRMGTARDRIEQRKQAILAGMNAAELADIGLKPADVPGMTLRR